MVFANGNKNRIRIRNHSRNTKSSSKANIKISSAVAKGGTQRHKNLLKLRFRRSSRDRPPVAARRWEQVYKIVKRCTSECKWCLCMCVCVVVFTKVSKKMLSCGKNPKPQSIAGGTSGIFSAPCFPHKITTMGDAAHVYMHMCVGVCLYGKFVYVSHENTIKRPE